MKLPPRYAHTWFDVKEDENGSWMRTEEVLPFIRAQMEDLEACEKSVLSYQEAILKLGKLIGCNKDMLRDTRETAKKAQREKQSWRRLAWSAIVVAWMAIFTFMYKGWLCLPF